MQKVGINVVEIFLILMRILVVGYLICIMNVVLKLMLKIETTSFMGKYGFRVGIIV